MMKLDIEAIGFFSSFLLIYFGMHLYVFGTLMFIFGISYLPSLAFALFFTFSFMIAAWLEKRYSTVLSRGFYTLAAAWMGILFLSLSIILLFHLLNLIFWFGMTNARWWIVGSITLVAVYGMIHAQFISVRTFKIPMPGLKQRTRVVQLTDVHIGTIHNKKFLSQVVRKTNALKPDIVLITGDLVDGSGPVMPHMFMGIKDIKARKFFSTGNHEFYEGLHVVTPVLEETGITILRNSAVTYKGIAIIGVDYHQGKRYLKAVLPEIKWDRSKPSILMNHVPEGFKYAQEHNVNLMISGHTHGGQIFPFSLILALFHNHFVGMFHKNNTHFYVSPGTGTWGPPMRIGTSNEITVFNLEPA